jgi:hypothetical protein
VAVNHCGSVPRRADVCIKVVLNQGGISLLRRVAAVTEQILTRQAAGQRGGPAASRRRKSSPAEARYRSSRGAPVGCRRAHVAKIPYTTRIAKKRGVV